MGDFTFTVRLRIVIKDKKGAVAETISIIAKQNSNVSNLRTVRRNVSFNELLLNIEVKNVTDLQKIISALTLCPFVISVYRGGI